VSSAPPVRRERRSIAQSLSFAVTAIATLVTIAALVVLLGYTWRRDNETLAGRADATMAFLIGSLRLPLWSLDLEAVTTIGRAVTQSEIVSRLEITGSRGDVVFSESRPGGVAFERHAPIIYQGRRVGAVRLAVSERPRLRQLWSVAVVAGLTGLSVIVLQLVLVGPLLRRHLRAPFESLDATIREYLDGRYDSPGPEVEYEEFQPLTDVLVRMGRRVDEQLRELRLAEAKYRRIFEKARVGIFQTTPEGGLLEVNPAWAEFLGYRSREEVMADVHDVAAQVYADPADRESFVSDLLRDGRVVRREIRMRRRDGSLMWASVSAEAVRDEAGRLVLIEGLADDITEHKEIQELRLQAEKMLSVGGLAAGMAHELNNPLGIILHAVEGLERRFSPDLPANQPAAAEAAVDLGAVAEYMEQRGIRGYVAAMRDAAERAARIIRTMLEFSRTEASGEAALCSLEPIVDTALELASKDYDLRRRFDFRSIRIVRDFDPATPQVLCSGGEMVQVIFNIVKNAAEAMAGGSASSGPEIAFRARADGAFARLEIQDNGPGIEEADRRRIFEPYFSTKGPGRGTGLGLAVVYFIVTQRHGGTISVESTPGKGTTFVLRLPAAPRPAEA
jgi:PAS domain S-box-containing protein